MKAEGRSTYKKIVDTQVIKSYRKYEIYEYWVSVN